MVFKLSRCLFLTFQCAFNPNAVTCQHDIFPTQSRESTMYTVTESDVMLCLTKPRFKSN